MHPGGAQYSRFRVGLASYASNWRKSIGLFAADQTPMPPYWRVNGVAIMYDAAARNRCRHR
jgi:hypothetical protein